jgi:hypothetical protein
MEKIERFQTVIVSYERKVTKSICGIADSGLKLFAKVSVSKYARHDILILFKFILSFLHEDFAINEFTKRVLKE